MDRARHLTNRPHTLSLYALPLLHKIRGLAWRFLLPLFPAPTYAYDQPRNRHCQCLQYLHRENTRTKHDLKPMPVTSIQEKNDSKTQCLLAFLHLAWLGVFYPALAEPLPTPETPTQRQSLDCRSTIISRDARAWNGTQWLLG